MVKQKNNSDDYNPTEGEIFIGEYLKSQNIKYKTELKINNLFNDSKQYRLADFYLPKYRVYIEYYGQWNKDKESRARYKEKSYVYIKNNIPCIYIYPDNLGIIDFTFPARMVKVLKTHGMDKELLKYRMKQFIDDRGNLFFYLALMLFVLIFGTFTWEKDAVLIIGMTAVCVYQVYRAVTGYFKFFRN
ncbi:MAG: hypothetical protein ACWA42_02280 [Lutibacter sp.]